MSTPEQNVVLQAKHITLAYASARTPVLENFSFDLQSGEIVALVGKSGVGKSSLLRVLAGLQKTAGGEVLVHGKTLTGPHPELSFVFQNPCLLPWLNLEQNVAFGLDFKHQPLLSADERRQRVLAAVEEAGLSAALHHRTSELSGGMAQRAALARALARQPRILLLDEPFSALDEVTREDMQHLLRRVVRHHAMSALIVTHDIDEALLLADRVLLLGGSPGHLLGEWRVDIPEPREEALRDLAELRISVLATLRHPPGGFTQDVSSQPSLSLQGV